MNKSALLVVAFAAACSGCNLPSPITEPDGPVVVRGTGPKGDRIVSQEIIRPYVVSVTPIGRQDGAHAIVYRYITAGGSEEPLRFLDEHRPGHKGNYLMKYFLALPYADRWVAFRLCEVSRAFVNVEVIIFTPARIISRHEVKQAIRRSLSAWEDPASYSIAIDPASATLCIETEAGWVSYDPQQDRFVAE